MKPGPFGGEFCLKRLVGVQGNNSQLEIPTVTWMVDRVYSDQFHGVSLRKMGSFASSRVL